jgi:HPt (histidine-containing phosphotransfer) domain-containing protein
MVVTTSLDRPNNQGAQAVISTEADSKPTGSEDENVPVDLSVVAEIMGEDDEEAVNYLLSLFQRTFPDVMIRLQMAIRDGLPGTIADAAHTAKGVASNTAAKNLERKLAALENAADECRMADVKALMQEVQQEANRVVSFMEAWSNNKRNQ